MAAPGAFMGAHLLMDRAYEGRNMVERVFNRMKHHRKAATRHDELDKALPANLQPILIAIHLKNTTKNPIRVNTP